MAADWTSIKTEYVTNPDSTYRELSAKYGVHYTNIAKKAKKEDWKQQRQQHVKNVQKKAQQAVEKRQVNRAARLDEAADLLLERVFELMASGDQAMVTSQALKHLSGVLKDIKDVKGFKSEEDMLEQRERIAKLRREAERDEGDRSKTVVVTIEGGAGEWQN